jgi:hypothetical protein
LGTCCCRLASREYWDPLGRIEVVLQRNLALVTSVCLGRAQCGPVFQPRSSGEKRAAFFSKIVAGNPACKKSIGSWMKPEAKVPFSGPVLSQFQYYLIIVSAGYYAPPYGRFIPDPMMRTGSRGSVHLVFTCDIAQVPSFSFTGGLAAGTTDMQEHCRESWPCVEPGVASRVCASARPDKQSLTTPKSSPDVGYEAISLVFSKKVRLLVFVIAHVGLLSTGAGEVTHWATALLSPSAGWAVCAVTAASPYRVERALCFLSRIPSLASFICSL